MHLQRPVLSMWGVALAGVLLVVPLPATSGLASYYFATQDRYAMAAALLVLVVADAAAPRIAVGSGRFFQLGESSLALFGVAVSVTLIGFAGAWLVFRTTPVAYDEVQAVFDARVFASGQLAAPVADAWRPFLSALGPTLFLQIPENRAWISAYLPLNAALRAAADFIVGASWCSPLLACLALASTHRVARQLWPDRPDAAFVAAALMATSSQLLVTAMTPYAMTAHLAMNMLWLALFLTNTRAAHLGALAVGAVGTGLHQVIFHPLFVAPFILLLLIQRRWALSVFYIGGYGLIGLGWLIYPEFVVWWNNPGAASGDPIASLVLKRWSGDVAAGLTGHADIASLMLLNLGRFVAWLNPLLVLFFVAGLAAARRLRGVERAIAAGVVFTFVAMTLILPYQGLGWGYRYMHGQIGCMALVAAMAWMPMQPGAARDRRTGFFAGATLLSLIVLVPLNTWFAYRWARPISAAMDIIAQSSADIVMVDYHDLPFGVALVRNRPDLSNRPLTMALEHLESSALRRLCVGHTIAVFDRSAAARVGMVGAQEPPADDPSWKSPQRVILDAECHPARL